MKLVVTTEADGELVDVEYDINDTLNNVSLGNLKILQKSTKDGDYPGTTRKLIKDTLNGWGDKQIVLLETWRKENPDADDDDFVPLDGDEFLADPNFVESVIGLIFLARRAAGSKDTVQDAADTPLSRWRFKPDEDEIEVESGPKEEPAVDPE